MSIVQRTARRVSEMVMEMLPQLRHRLSREEAILAPYLRGNQPLMDALRGIIDARIEGRATTAEPINPLTCKSYVARDRELRWLLARLEYVYLSPVGATAEDEGEQPE